MKTLKIFLFVALISFMAGCDKNGEFFDNEAPELKKAQVEVTVPFEANLLGTVTNVDFENQECIDAGFLAKPTVDASGNATHMGKVSVIMSFCAFGPDDPDVPGDDNKYAGSEAVMTAANGDKLFLYLEGGTVIYGRTDAHPDNVTDYWQDKITVTGGTGRFEGASGVLQMDDFSTNIDPYMHHHWYGKITLVKGNK